MEPYVRGGFYDLSAEPGGLAPFGFDRVRDYIIKRNRYRSFGGRETSK